MKQRFLALTPFLVLLYFFVHNTTDFFYFLHAAPVLTTLIKYTIATALLYFTGRIFFKNKEKFTLQFSGILFIFLFFGPFMDMANKYMRLDKSGGFYSKQAVIFLSLCVAIVLLTAWLRKATLLRLVKFLIIYCLVLCVYDTGIFLLFPKKEKKYLAAPNVLRINPGSEKPSVFFFVFDMYPSDSVFSKYLNYDNSQLGIFLRQKDFFVTGNSHSLYDATYYSLCSTLNFTPLDFYEDPTLTDYKKTLISLKQLEHTSLLNAFEKEGYTFRNFSVLDLQDQPSPLNFNMTADVGNLLTSTTFFNRIYQTIEPDFFLAYRKIDMSFLKESWSHKVKKDIVLLDKGLDNVLDSFSVNQKPSFNYFHFPIPHPPAVYDSNGIENTVKNMYAFSGLKKAAEAYTSYTKYGNIKIREMVNKIFAKAGKEVIIIIQGDHGYREFSNIFPAEVRYGILNAVYLPSQNYAGFNDSITPINIFKQILFNQFNTIVK